MVAQVAVGKTPRQQTKHQQRAEQRLHGHVGETQGTGPLPIDLDRFIDPTERVFADRAIVAESLDVQETSVGLKADLPQGGQIMQPFADAEVAGVVDGGLGAQGAAFLVILLDPRVLVVDVQRRRHASVNTRVRNRPGVCLVTRRSKISCT